MKQPMRLFKKRGWYHVETSRNHSQALKTKDLEKAKEIFAEMEEEWLRGRLFLLEGLKKINIDAFKGKYIAARSAQEDLSAETIKKDELCLKLMADVLGNSIQLRAITKHKIEDFKAACMTRKVTKITVNGYLRHLKTAFKWAVSEGYLPKTPEIVMYKRLRKPESQLLARILEPSEIRKALKKAYKMKGRLFGIYCETLLWEGGRRREILGLEWQRVNFKADRLTVRGKTGERTIPLLSPVRKLLEPLRRDIGRVFPDWHPDTVSHWFKEAMRAAGIEDHRLHDLRHTCATYLLKNEVSLEVVQRIMGHAQIATTQIYAKVFDDIMQAEMKKLKFK
jgi:integrase